VSSAAEQSLASRRDGSADRRRADVTVACRGPRGQVLGMLVQRRRDSRAALRPMREAFKKQGFAPRLLVADKRRSYASASRRLRLTCP